MEVKRSSIAKFMEQPKTQFQIPVFQRNYDWKQEQCQQLLKDILEVGKTTETQNHFVGSIVYLQTDLQSKPSLLTIIDGQQRLTTLTLLWIALHRHAIQSMQEEAAEEIWKSYLINEFVKGEAKIKLRPIKKDNEALEHLLHNSDNPWNGNYSQIIENYQFFYDSINNDNFDIIRIGIEKLVLIEIALEKGKDDPQQIFQSMNSTGLDLSQADLIRNYVLLHLESQKQEELYKKYWTKIEENTQEIKKQETRLSDFIRDYLTLQNRDIPNKDKVFITFQNKYQFKNKNGLKDEAILIDTLSELRSYSVWYGRLINPDLERDENIKEQLQLLNRASITVAYPFLLYVYRDYNDGKGVLPKEEFIKVLELIQSFTFRRFLCDLPTNALNKIFATLHNEINPKKYLKSIEISLASKQGKHRFPVDSEIKNALTIKDMYNIKPNNRMYFFERLENFGYKIKKQIEGNSQISIEHIFPQNPSQQWKKELGDELEEMQALLHTMANLTLSAFNPSLSNLPFLKKRDMPEKGYRESTLRLDKFLAKIDRWDIRALSRRRKELITRCLKIWPYPDVAITQSTTIDILDIEPSEVTGKKLAEVIFEGETLSKPSFIDLYRFVCKKMFEREPHAFMALDRAGKLWVKNNPSVFKKPFKISPTHYIESHFSASDLISRLQLILEACETDDELILRFES